MGKATINEQFRKNVARNAKATAGIAINLTVDQPTRASLDTTSRATTAKST
jgi:hypothetical protein